VSAHTPGPWSVCDEHPDGVLDRAVKTADGFYVATVHDTDCGVPWDADARLMASAPELLEALQGLFADDGSFTGRHTTQAVVDACRTAIARATTQREGSE
jgi:hypothetical protein